MCDLFSVHTSKSRKILLPLLSRLELNSFHAIGMKKKILDLAVTANISLNDSYVLLKARSSEPLPPCKPGQFAQLRVDGSQNTFLRRPISINWVDKANNEVWFLIQKVGEGTQKLATHAVGSTLNVILPLGNNFSIPTTLDKRPLLVGGGVGVAPLLLLGKKLLEYDIKPIFLLGARSKQDLLELDLFNEVGTVFCTTEDGSFGEKGYVTQHSVLKTPNFSQIYTCGPKPMMVAVAAYAKKNEITCEVSLENLMACGIGACLCCVEKTTEGHKCACTEGPVFNINELQWQI